MVTKVVDYGVFVRLEEGLEGLVHQSNYLGPKKMFILVNCYLPLRKLK